MELSPEANRGYDYANKVVDLFNGATPSNGLELMISQYGEDRTWFLARLGYGSLDKIPLVTAVRGLKVQSLIADRLYSVKVDTIDRSSQIPPSVHLRAPIPAYLVTIHPR